MSPAENERLVRQYMCKVNNQGSTGGAELLCSPDYLLHNPALPGPLQEPVALKGFWQAIFAAFPDFHFEAEDIIAAGDKVVVRGTCSGTFKGNFSGIEPTGKHTTWEAIAIYRIADGKFTEMWEQLDLLGAWQRLGVLPMPG